MMSLVQFLALSKCTIPHTPVCVFALCYAVFLSFCTRGKQTETPKVLELLRSGEEGNGERTATSRMKVKRVTRRTKLAKRERERERKERKSERVRKAKVTSARPHRHSREVLDIELSNTLPRRESISFPKGLSVQISLHLGAVFSARLNILTHFSSFFSSFLHFHLSHTCVHSLYIFSLSPSPSVAY
jgi:hypothetical protein